MKTIPSGRIQPAFLPRTLLLLWAAALLAVIVAAPLATSAARPEGWFLYQAFDPFCHQNPQRSFQLRGQPWAVCTRCTGVYAGLLLAALLGLRLPAKAIAVTLGLLAASWAAEFAGIAAVPAGVRFGTGLLLGGSIGAAVLAWAPHRNRAARSCPAVDFRPRCNTP